MREGTCNRIYTKEDLQEMLARMGIRPSDTLVIHSSMKAIGQAEGGADTVLDAWMEYMSRGLLILPTHTWRQMGKEHRIFDPAEEPSCVGLLTEMFRKRPGVLRSLHPTHSVAVYGRGSREYIEGEELCNTPCTKGGCWSRMDREHTKILLVGVGHERNTFIHAVEEALEVPERLTPEPELFYIKMADGSLMERPMYRHYNPKTDHISEAYPKLEQAFYDTGAAVRGQFGDAACILCDAGKTAETVRRVLSHEINCLIDREQIPEEWWKHTL